VATTSKNSSEASQGKGTYVRLLEEIRTGSLRPGARLTETELAKRLNVSRTPVREAIRKLEADGLVEHVARVGAVVRTLDYAEIIELYEMRAVLESTAARMAAHAATKIEIEELEEINTEMADAIEDSDRIYELNRQFHLLLLGAAKNRFLIKSMATLQKTLMILGATTLSETARASSAIEEHRAVLVALRDRDALAAESSMRAHIEAAHRTRLQKLRNRVRPIDAD